MYSSPMSADEVVFEPSDAADERTIAWLKRDLERRRAERGAASAELVSSK